MPERIQQAYLHSQLSKVPSLFSDWVRGSRLVAWLALRPGRIDPFAGSIFIIWLLRIRDDIILKSKVSQKSQPWRQNMVGTNNNFINAPGRFFCLFLFIAAATDLSMSLFGNISPAAIMIRIFTMGAAAFGFFLTEINTCVPGSRLLKAIGQFVDAPTSDEVESDHFETYVQ